MFRLTTYGRREWLGVSAIAAPLCALMAAGGVWLSAWFWAALVPTAAIWAWVLWFFRDPQRRPPQGEHLFVSPADGRVTDITPLGPDSSLGRRGVQVGIFMSVFDVHVNRSPCEGRIERVERRDGVFLDARDPHASARNESATIHIAHCRGGRDYPVVVRQIAGLVARRIVTDVRQGDQAPRGRRIGMIKFGSRVELMVCDELSPRVCVEIGLRVQAGRTVIVETREPKQ